jgi:transposase InsO family protein
MYVNVAASMTVTGTNQLWVADITHVRLKREFAYLAVLLDRFSRKVVGWAIDRNLTSRLSLAALRSALEHRMPPPGLVHHSDRGPQYIHSGYLRMLRKHGMVPSVSRPGNPGDNANCESFFRTLKREEVEAKEYADLENLRLNISQFIERYYNEERLHSALGYRSPTEFERLNGGPRAAHISSDVELFRTDLDVQSVCEQKRSQAPVSLTIVSTRGS